MTTYSTDYLERLATCRAEAIELVNKGYLAKAIIHLEKELGDQTPARKLAAFRMIKSLTLGGEIKSKEEIIGLIRLI